ncbi:hypothetical protein J1N35_010056, partial [Gossypium stocksii]
FRFPFLRPRVDHPYTFPLITSYVGISTSLKDIRLLLDQQSKAQVKDLAIRAVIPDEFFQNSNIWHVKVPLVNYATVEMHQSDRVLRQFRFRCLMMSTKSTYGNCIRVGRDTGHTISKCGKIELACVPEYMPWFRIHGKPYLLSEEERRWQIRVQRGRRGLLNPRRRNDDAGPSTAPTQSPGPSIAPT